jgi:hypothetical protein
MSVHAHARWLAVFLFPAFLFPASLLAAPVGTNTGFENGLTGWTYSNVAVETGGAFEGDKRLNLKNGFISQTFSGLVAGQRHSVRLAYIWTGADYLLGHARVKIDGVTIGEIHNGQTIEYLSCNGFEFIAAAATAVLRIESLETGTNGLRIDAVRIEAGGLPLPPETAWANLQVMTDARGGRALVNGGFETAIGSPTNDPNNSGPVGNEHLCGFSLPGWLVTRENIDVIKFSSAKPPQGANALDTGGHGPGGIAQTITGLSPGAAYKVSFWHARHIYWGTGDMTGDFLANGQVVASLVRTINQTWDQGYSLMSIPVIAGQDGRLTVEVRSTTLDQGGNIIYDDFRISKGGDLFGKWAAKFGVAASQSANDDGDSFSNGMEFALRLDPTVRSDGPRMVVEGRVRSLRVPVSGEALAQGFLLRLECCRDLSDWAFAGATLESDSSAPGIDGERIYRFQAGERRLFWRHALTSP